MLLKRLEIRNIRRIKQAEIEFHGPGVQIIEGVNQSGKTSVAQSIALSLNGSRDFTPGMIRRGEESAEIIAYTDDGLEIRTIINDKVEQKVKRYDETFCRFVNVSGGVRTFLGSICSGMEMPWSLRDMTDAKIIDLLKKRAGVTFEITAIDEALKEKETERTEVGRDKKRLGEPAPVAPANHPDPIDGIKTEREEAVEYLKWVRGLLDAAEASAKETCRFSSCDDISLCASEIGKLAKEIKAKISTRKPYTRAFIDACDERLTAWYDLEQKAVAYDVYRKTKDEYDRLSHLYDDLTREIEDLRIQRKKVLSGMKLGVKGLEISEDNLLYHNGALRGITDTNKSGNWSTAESVQVFFGLGARFSGDLKVLVVDNAESLDSKTTDTISKWAESAGFLVVMLRVAETPDELEEGVIYLKEGEVLAKGVAN